MGIAVLYTRYFATHRTWPRIRAAPVGAPIHRAASKTLSSMDLTQPMLIDETCMRHYFAHTTLPDIDAPAMLRLERRSVSDGDNRGARQPLTQQPIDHALGWLVE